MAGLCPGIGPWNVCPKRLGVGVTTSYSGGHGLGENHGATTPVAGLRNSTIWRYSTPTSRYPPSGCGR